MKNHSSDRASFNRKVTGSSLTHSAVEYDHEKPLERQSVIQSKGHGFESHPQCCVVRPWKAAHAHLPLSPSSIIWNWWRAVMVRS